MTERSQAQPTSGNRRTSAARPKSVRNVLTSWGAFAVSVLINLFLTPYIVRELGDTGYGIWILLASAVGYMGLLDLGVRSAMTRYIARLHAKGDDLDASEIASTGLTIFLVLGALAVVIAIGLAALLPHIFNLPASWLTEARIVVLISAAAVVVALLDGVYGGVVSAMQRFDLAGVIQIANAILRALAIVVALHAGYGLVALALIQLASTALRVGTNLVLSKHLYPELFVNVRMARRSLVRPVMTFGAFSAFLYMSRSLIMGTDALVIGTFLQVRMVTFFSIAGSLVSYTRQVIGSLAQIVTPQASALQALKAHDDLQRLVLRMCRVSLLVVAPIAITFIVRGGTFIGIWMGKDYVELSGHVLLILALSLFSMSPGRVLHSALIGTNRHRLLVPFRVAEGILNLAMSIVLVRRWGIIGVAWGTTIPSILITIVSIPWLMKRTLQITYWSVFKEVWLLPLVSAVPFALATAWVEGHTSPQNLAVFFLEVAATLPFAVIGAWVLGMTSEERRHIMARAARFRGNASSWARSRR